MSPLQSLLMLPVWAMMAAIIGSVIISWLRMLRVNVPYSNALVRLIEETADLMLRPIRNAIPVSGGGLDFSPLVALIILSIIGSVIRRLPV